MLSLAICWILTPLSLLFWVSESFRQDIGQFHSPRMKPYRQFGRFTISSRSILCCSGWNKVSPDNLQIYIGKAFFITIKNMFIMKNLTDFCNMVETGVDPRLN